LIDLRLLRFHILGRGRTLLHHLDLLDLLLRLA
jgi:hypothetical protein